MDDLIKIKLKISNSTCIHIYGILRYWALNTIKNR